MIEEQIISKETATLAKEKGFNTIQYDGIGGYYTNCTQSLLQRWLRETHNIKVYLLWYDDKVKKPRWSIYVDKTYINGDNNYEDALEAGLVEALKLL